MPNSSNIKASEPSKTSTLSAPTTKTQDLKANKGTHGSIDANDLLKIQDSIINSKKVQPYKFTLKSKPQSSVSKPSTKTKMTAANFKSSNNSNNSKSKYRVSDNDNTAGYFASSYSQHHHISTHDNGTSGGGTYDYGFSSGGHHHGTTSGGYDHGNNGGGGYDHGTGGGSGGGYDCGTTSAANDYGSGGGYDYGNSGGGNDYGGGANDW